MEEQGGTWRSLVVLVASPFHGHMTPTLQLAAALHAKGFSIAIAHSRLSSPDPSNHPGFIFLPLQDNLSAIDPSYSFIKFIQTLNINCKAPLHEHLTRLIKEQKEENKNKSIVIIYDHVMFSAGVVAAELNFASIVFRSCSAAYFPAFLARLQLHQQGKFPQEDSLMQEMVPNLHPLRYKDLPFSKLEVQDSLSGVASSSQQSPPSAVIWNTVEFLEHEPLTQIHQHYQVPVFAVGPLHKITPTPPTREEDTGCITWLDKQLPRSVIYISFGSLATLDSKVVAEMAWGLANSNQPFLWAVRPGSVDDCEWVEFFPEGFVEETRGRGLIVKWAPQKEVLAHSAVGGFWSHCGWNSMLESISEGVPLICYPFFIDQGVNARYGSYVWRIGIELECLERVEIESAIRRVMVGKEGEEMRVKAADTKAKVKDAVENGGSSHNALNDLVSFILSC